MEDSSEKFLSAAPRHYKELIAEVKYSDISVQARKSIIEIILEYVNLCQNYDANGMPKREE